MEISICLQYVYYYIITKLLTDKTILNQAHGLDDGKVDTPNRDCKCQSRIPQINTKLYQFSVFFCTKVKRIFLIVAQRVAFGIVLSSERHQNFNFRVKTNGKIRGQP